MAENIGLGLEIFRNIGRKVRGSNLVLKLDMEKAYDKVEWGFMVQVLLKGLRQGDPLSPSVFILCAEVFSRSISRLVAAGTVTPFRLKQGCIQISHLLYADDTILFLNGAASSLSKMRQFISKYQEVLGQKVNPRKSALFVSSKVLPGRVRSIERSLGFYKADGVLSYLGVPIVKGRMLSSVFKPLLDKISARVQGWNVRLFSQASHLTLISHVLSNIPIHSLAAIILLAKVIGLMERSFSNFF
ncbi:uncharacterized protein LOC131247064 [Magnolia sinica]|uniref:uncharacterized protein LOC131247064 n=1 Tax=Magnolia sinica TaxID=86752 RepID=UPI002658433D|nr:uncharacterized protein LOC131247064 [Magnolia sinica]